MTISSLLMKTKEYYEMARITGNKYSIVNVFKGYDAFNNLYSLHLISKETFKELRHEFYSMATVIYTSYVYGNEKMYDEIIELCSSVASIKIEYARFLMGGMKTMFECIVYFFGGMAFGTILAYIAEAIDNCREEKRKHEKNN